MRATATLKRNVCLTNETEFCVCKVPTYSDKYSSCFVITVL